MLLAVIAPLLAQPPAPASAQQIVEGDAVPVVRLAGPSRTETALAIATAGADAGRGTRDEAVLIARSDAFADGLAGAYVAGLLDASILLTPTDTLDEGVRAHLADTSPPSRIILGGEAAISSAVADALGATTRLSAADRYGTAARLALQRPRGEARFPSTVLVASGEDWPDALAAGAVSSGAGIPLLLVGRDHLPSATADALAALDPEDVILVGGTAAVTDDVAEALDEAAGRVERIAGADRYGTAAALAGVAIDRFGFGVSQFNLASGDRFADALGLAALAGRTVPIPTPLLLSPGAAAAPATTALIEARSDCTTRRIVVAGGEQAVDDTTVSSYARAAVTGESCEVPDAPQVTVEGPDGAAVADGDVLQVTDDDGLVELTGTAADPLLEEVTISLLNGEDFAEEYVGYAPDGTRQRDAVVEARRVLLDEDGRWRAPALLVAPGEYLFSVEATSADGRTNRVVFTIDFAGPTVDQTCTCIPLGGQVITIDNVDGFDFDRGDIGSTVPQSLILDATPETEDEALVLFALEEAFYSAGGTLLLATGPDVPDEDAFVAVARLAGIFEQEDGTYVTQLSLEPATPDQLFASGDFTASVAPEPTADGLLDPASRTGCGPEVDLAAGRFGVGCVLHIDEEGYGRGPSSPPSAPDVFDSQVSGSALGFDLDMGITAGLDLDLQIRPLGVFSGSVITRFGVTTFGELEVGGRIGADAEVSVTVCEDDRRVPGRTACSLPIPDVGFTFRPHPLLPIRVAVDDIHAQVRATVSGGVQAGAAATVTWRFGFLCDDGCEVISEGDVVTEATALDLDFAGSFDAWAGPRIQVSPYDSGIGIWVRPEIFLNATDGIEQERSVTSGVRASWGMSAGFLERLFEDADQTFDRVPVLTIPIVAADEDASPIPITTFASPTLVTGPSGGLVVDPDSAIVGRTMFYWVDSSCPPDTHYFSFRARPVVAYAAVPRPDGSYGQGGSSAAAAAQAVAGQQCTVTLDGTPATASYEGHHGPHNSLDPDFTGEGLSATFVVQDAGFESPSTNDTTLFWTVDPSSPPTIEPREALAEVLVRFEYGSDYDESQFRLTCDGAPVEFVRGIRMADGTSCVLTSLEEGILIFAGLPNQDDQWGQEIAFTLDTRFPEPHILIPRREEQPAGADAP